MNRSLLLWILVMATLAGCKSPVDYLEDAGELSSAGNVSGAIHVLEKGIEKNPFYIEAYIELAHCYENVQRLDSAIVIYNQLLGIYPRNTAANYYAGICKYNQKQFREAIVFFNKALECKGGFNSADTTSFQAMLDLNKDQFETESAEIDIPTCEIVYDRAMAYYEAGQIKNACCDFSNCIFQNYNTAQSHHMIGICRQKKHKTRLARF